MSLAATLGLNKKSQAHDFFWLFNLSNNTKCLTRWDLYTDNTYGFQLISTRKLADTICTAIDNAKAHLGPGLYAIKLGPVPKQETDQLGPYYRLDIQCG